MEINKINGDVLGVVTGEAIKEGRMVVIAGSGDTYDFGSRTDLPEVYMPTTEDLAKRARFVLTWAVNNSKMPMYQPQPAFEWALRGGWDQTANLPMTATTVYTTYPGHQDCVEIPEQTPALAFGAGTYTVPSGCYIYNVGLTTPGAALNVNYTGANAGLLQYSATWDDSVVALVHEYNSSTGALTFITQMF